MDTNSVIQRALAIWNGLSLSRRIMLGGAAAALVVGSFLFSGFGRGPDFAVAYANLSDQDELAVVTKLKDSKIPYQLGDNGTVRVPASQVNDVRVLMAPLGLSGKPSTGQGFEIFSQPAFGLTDFAQRVNYQVSLQDELARSIQQLNAVQSARVQIAMPQDTLFTSQQKDATASVIVQLKPGMYLDSSQVHAITALMTGSVPGLKAQNLSVVDTNGNTLTDDASSPIGNSSQQLQFQHDLQNRTAQSLQGLLDRVLGPGRAVVQVSADINWDNTEQTLEAYQPDPTTQPVVSAKHEITETTQPGVPVAGGVPGTTSNDAAVPTYQAGQTTASGPSTKSDVQTTYDVTKSTTKTVHTGGTLKRLNVSVLLDQASVDPNQVDAIKAAIGTAAGVDTEGRGDQITVLAMPFNNQQATQAEDAAKQAQQQAQLLSYIRLGLLALGPILLLVALWLILGRSGGGKEKTARKKKGEDQKDQAPVVEQAAAVVDNYLSRQPSPAITQDPRKVYLQEQINLLAQSNPGTVANLIQTWIDEDER